MSHTIDPTARVVVIPIGIGTYEKPDVDRAANGFQRLDALRFVSKDLAKLQALFTSPRFADEGFQFLPPFTGSSWKIHERLHRIANEVAATPGRRVVVIWSGHAQVPDSELRLATRESYTPMLAGDGVSPAELVKKLAACRADALYVVFDVCQAAQAAGDVAEVAAQRFRNQPPDRQSFPGFAAIFSAQPYETAKDGVFVDVLERVLMHGPSAEARRVIAERGFGGFNHNRLLTPAELDSVIQVEFDLIRREHRFTQRPSPVVIGGEFGLFPNPLFEAGAPPERVDVGRRRWLRDQDAVTHFLPKARGLEPGEDGWYFAGRVDVSRRLVEWLDGDPATASNPLYVLTGDGGSGKSAVIGRIVALSDATFRGALAGAGWSEATDRIEHTLPRLDGIDAALHLRGLTARATADATAELLGLTRWRAEDDLSTFVNVVAAAGSARERPVTIVFDALDEAEEPGLVADAIIRPLAHQGCRILVGSRASAASRGAPDLLVRLGDHLQTDLLAETETGHDIAAYVLQRLAIAPGSPYADNRQLRQALSDAIASRARRRFLYARLSVDSLLRRPISSVGEIDDALAANAGDAFARELAELDNEFRNEFGRADAGASALARALAWSEGQGLPLRDELWPLVASAIEQPTEPYTSEHARWVLRAAGRYIVESGDGEQAVYRLYHESLNEHLRAASRPSSVSALIATALLDHVEFVGGWRLANPYAVKFVLAHIGGDGARAERVATDPNFLSRAHALMGVDALAALLDAARIATGSFPVEAVAKVLRRARVALHRDPGQLAAQLRARLYAEADPVLRELVTALPGIAPPVWLAADQVRLGWRATLQTVQTFQGNVRAIAFGDVNGQTVIGVGAATEVVVWDPRVGEAPWKISHDGARVTALAFGVVDGRPVVAVGAAYEGPQVVVRDLLTGAAVSRLVAAGGPWSVAFGQPPEGARPAVGTEYIADGRVGTVVGEDGTIVWWSSAGCHLFDFGGQLQLLEFTDSHASLSDVRTGAMSSFDTGSQWSPVVASIGRDSDGPLLVDYTQDRVVRVLRPGGQRIGDEMEFGYELRCVAIGRVDGELVVAVASGVDGRDEKVSAYVALRQPLRSETANQLGGLPPQLKQTCGIGRIGSRLVALGPAGDPVDPVTLDVVVPTAESPLQLLSGWSTAPEVAAPRRSRPESDPYDVQILPVDDPHQWPVTAVAWGQMGRRVVQLRGSYYGAVWIYDVGVRAFVYGPFASIPDQPRARGGKGFQSRSVTGVALGQIGRRSCIAAASDGRVDVYELVSGKSLPAPAVSSSGIVAVAFGRVHSRSLVATGSDGGAVAVWDAATGERLTGITLDDPIDGLWIADDTLVVRTYDRPFDLFKIVDAG